VGLEGDRIEVAALVKALIQAVMDYTQPPLAPVPEERPARWVSIIRKTAAQGWVLSQLR
jgi:hypothetical protein